MTICWILIEKLVIIYTVLHHVIKRYSTKPIITLKAITCGVPRSILASDKVETFRSPLNKGKDWFFRVKWRNRRSWKKWSHVDSCGMWRQKKKATSVRSDVVIDPYPICGTGSTSNRTRSYLTRLIERYMLRQNWPFLSLTTKQRVAQFGDKKWPQV